MKQWGNKDILLHRIFKLWTSDTLMESKQWSSSALQNATKSVKFFNQNENQNLLHESQIYNSLIADLFEMESFWFFMKIQDWKIALDFQN